MSVQLTLNFTYGEDIKPPEKKKPKRIRSKNPKKKVYRNDVTIDGVIIDDVKNWRTLRGYAVELYKLCGFIPFGSVESIEQCGITVVHETYKREPYEHQGNLYIGQEFEHYEAEVTGTGLLPVLDRIKIYKEVISRLKQGLSLEQTMQEVKPIIEDIKEALNGNSVG